MSDDKIPETVVSNYIDLLEDNLREKMEEEELPYDQAFIYTALEYLEVNSDNGTISDGKGDHGIDYWEVHDDGAVLYQFKSHDFTEEFNQTYKIEPKQLDDLRQIQELIRDLDRIPAKANRKVLDCLQELRATISEQKSVSGVREEQVTYNIEIHFVALAFGLTPQAGDEFKKIAEVSRLTYDGVDIALSYSLVLLEDLIESKWRQLNSKWTNKSGKHQDKIDISVVGYNDKASMIIDNNWCVFFGKAVDLVQAYRDLGYQIFEPNVRCELRNSKINHSIKETLMTAKGRRNFKHLNNGITIICDTFVKPSANKTRFVLQHPGVINGLQTVKALNDAYKNMDANAKDDFSKETAVLIRLHAFNPALDTNQLIKSTNDQNPMKRRNLRSNEPEQIHFQAMFCERFGWFYARKEKEWEAYRSDPKAWKWLGGKKPDFFKANSTYKKLDNLEIAQAYFSFIGFTTEAMHRKKDLFEDDNIYQIIFKHQMAKHGSEYGYSFGKNKNDILSDSTIGSPSPALLLLSILCVEFAKTMAISSKTLRESAIERHGLKGKAKETINSFLRDDKSFYVKEYIIRGTVYVFAELVGFVLFRSHGDNWDKAAERLLKNGTMRKLFEKHDCTDSIEVIRNGTFDTTDVIATMWKLYELVIDGLAHTKAWHEDWKAQTNLSQFHYSEDTRERILKDFDDLNITLGQREIFKSWSSGLEKSKGIYKFLKQCLHGI